MGNCIGRRKNKYVPDIDDNFALENKFGLFFLSSLEGNYNL